VKSLLACPSPFPLLILRLECLKRVCRYSYYLAAGSKLFRIPVVVKKSITQIQLIQFAFVLAQVRPKLCLVTFAAANLIIDVVSSENPHSLNCMISAMQASFGLFVATYYRPRIIIWLALSQAVIFMILFRNFFRSAPLPPSHPT
jgi:hypothetical protein